MLYLIDSLAEDLADKVQILQMVTFYHTGARTVWVGGQQLVRGGHKQPKRRTKSRFAEGIDEFFEQTASINAGLVQALLGHKLHLQKN